MLVPKPAEFPNWIQAGQKIEDLLIEERIPNLHGGMHGDTVPFALQEMSGQGDACRHPYAAIQRMPAFGALQWHLQIRPRIEFLQHFAHRRSVEPKLREPEHSVGVYPGVWAA